MDDDLRLMFGIFYQELGWKQNQTSLVYELKKQKHQLYTSDSMRDKDNIRFESTYDIN